MIHLIRMADLKPNRVISFSIFDPLLMDRQAIEIRMLGEEPVEVLGRIEKAGKVSISYQGNTQLAWIDKKGEILKESGLLGIELRRTSRNDALFGLPVASSRDLTEVASIPANRIIDRPEDLIRLTARVEGLDHKYPVLDGFRQTFENDLLTVIKEQLPAPGETYAIPESISEQYLTATSLIQSDHPRIERLARRITESGGTPLAKIEQLMAWIKKEIKKRPVLTVPDALSTLKHRMGDCNEHSVLLAAFARAVGIPASVEVGLVYLRKRFYYHAWNKVYLGRWVTVDALFDQIPADVTHLRLIGGTESLPLDLIAMIGKIKIQIEDMELGG